MFQNTYTLNLNIYDWEIQFWQNKINNPTYELYNSAIDTTFCLINKNYIYNNFNIRIAGDFKAKHLPWYKKNKIHTDYENYSQALKTTDISTIRKMIVPYIENRYTQIWKNNSFFLIEKDDVNIDFWQTFYKDWEKERFLVYDRFLSPDKIFIEIGGWIGTSTMYCSRKSKFVYCVEADHESFRDLSKNMEINCDQNYTLINKAMYHIDDIDVTFGKNMFLNHSKMNDSTSQILTKNDETYEIKTITIQRLLNDIENIENIENISLIKVDIEGGEQYILNDLFSIHQTHNIPLYISFHYSWWTDKNLDRFPFLSEDYKKTIITYPLVSLLFT